MSLSPTRILSISPELEDHRFFQQLFPSPEWEVACATCASDGVVHLHDPGRSVVVCAHDLPDGTWRDILAVAEEDGAEAPVIVTSRAADDFLWAEVLGLGAYDLLLKPFDLPEVHRVVALAAGRAASLVLRATA
jgi:DNA-binding NtrC family response regulator